MIQHDPEAGRGLGGRVPGVELPLLEPEAGALDEVVLRGALVGAARFLWGRRERLWPETSCLDPGILYVRHLARDRECA